MGETTIQWTNFTFNPWEGCEKVSPGCKHCYAEARDKRFTGGKHWGPDGVRRRTVPSNWFQPTKWNRDAQRAGVRARVFCASLADVFEDRPELAPWRLDLFKLIRTTPWLDWQLLTKRPQNVIAALLESYERAKALPPIDFSLTARMLDEWMMGKPPANVWLGCTVENNEMARERIPHLLAVDAAVRFISCEPLLERTTLGLHHLATGCGPKPIKTTGIDWVIIGGESGDQARPFHVDWARDLLQECLLAGVAPFVKQLGFAPMRRDRRDWRDSISPLSCIDLHDKHGGDWDEWPDYLHDLRVREFPR